MVQMICGWVALVTSARTYAGDPCMTSRASCAVGWRVQVADMVAQVGTCEPVGDGEGLASADGDAVRAAEAVGDIWTAVVLVDGFRRSEEHTSELQSPVHLVCRLLL